MSEKSENKPPQDAPKEAPDPLEAKYRMVGIGAVSAAAPYCKPAKQPAKRQQ